MCERLRRAVPLFFAVVSPSLAVVALAGVVGHRFVWNLSPSLPRGLYVLDGASLPARGAIVSLPAPPAAAALIAERGYLPKGASLLKIVVGLPRDAVRVTAGSFSVEGRVIGPVASRDSRGRPLTPFEFCGVVPPGNAFVATTAPLSFDSRYFGPVPLSSLTVVVPVWTF